MKYKLTENSIDFDGKKLYQIQATKNFGDVKEGDLGGYVEHKLNLSQNGNCWIFEYAKVFENAKIFGFAKVFKNAQISGTVQISGTSKIFGNAKISGNILISEDTQIYGNAQISVNK